MSILRRYVIPFAAVLALAAATVGFRPQPSQAATGKSSPGHSTGFSGWYDTDANAAGSRANLIESVLSPSTVPKVRYLRSITSRPTPPGVNCPNPIVAPLPAGGYLYAIVNSKLSKYNPATGKLIWRSTPDPAFDVAYESLAISGNIIVVGGSVCDSASSPGSAFYAFNAATGKLAWKAHTGEGLNQAVVTGSYVVTAGEDAAGSYVTVLSLRNGKTIWSGSECYGALPPIVVAQLVMAYGCDSQGNPALEALKLTTGAVAWRKPTGPWQVQRGDLSGPTGKHVYATNPSGTVVDLNPQTGQVEYSLTGAVNVLAVDLSRVYTTCGSQAFYVCAYNITTGALEWQNTQPEIVGTAFFIPTQVMR
jgi:outer membrane protein assembly factor BamB